MKEVAVGDLPSGCSLTGLFFIWQNVSCSTTAHFKPHVDDTIPGVRLVLPPFSKKLPLVRFRASKVVVGGRERTTHRIRPIGNLSFAHVHVPCADPRDNHLSRIHNR